MATWPSGTKASTDNLDAGTDKPSLARADIKQNVDNVNDIIDMFNITSPTDGQILKYNTSNTRFELATDSTGSGGITSVVAGTGISVDQTSEGGVTITNTVTDTDTTYTISVVDDIGGAVNIRLTGSDASTDDIQLVPGENITLTVDSAGAVTIDSAAGAGGITTVSPGTNIDVTEDSAGGVTVSLESVVDGIELKDYKETVYALSYAATITPDVANGNVQEITLTGNVTFGGFSNVEDGQSMTLIIHQDATGNRTFSEGLSSAGVMLFAGGDSTLSTSGDATDIISIVYTGGIYYASLAKDFS